MAAVQYAFVITVDASSVWSAAQLDVPTVGTTKPDSLFFNETPLSLTVSGLSINYQNRLPSLDAALEFVRGCVAALASRLLADKK